MNDNIGCAIEAKPPTYADQIVSRQENIIKKLRVLKEKTTNVAGDMPTPSDPTKRLEPFNFMERVIDDLENIEQLINMISRDIDKVF